MNLNRIINDYVECNEFEIRLINNKVKIYFYDKIEHFGDGKIIISSSDRNYIINGKNLIIETMSEEILVISGNIESIELGNKR